MKLSTTILTSMLILSPLEIVYAEKITTGCEAKRQNIERQLDYAQTYGNTHRVAGLQTALSKNSAYCTDAGLRAKQESDVRKKERKIEKRRQELAEARANGREDKIRNKERKLKKAQDELAEAKSIVNQ
ncbi:DUF1090 domain-containing protein [Enterobacter wuhouensis]|uniref:DUF1090 domain-containing protein n=1 Tax=Enterobacter wuhouensis TaxID=2529381 RepID=A0ABZ1DGB8_9ENTR|nr:DUF1090 domain-containing protein [Enterobacter wuhouensis]WRW31675.1 DUF1090 domain-containing protein [Enterobacter wuhouensis]